LFTIYLPVSIAFQLPEEAPIYQSNNSKQLFRKYPVAISVYWYYISNYSNI